MFNKTNDLINCGIALTKEIFKLTKEFMTGNIENTQRKGDRKKILTTEDNYW